MTMLLLYSRRSKTSSGAGRCGWRVGRMLVTAMIPTYGALAHGLAGGWDEFALLLLAPVVVAAVLWVTRRGDDDGDSPPGADC